MFSQAGAARGNRKSIEDNELGGVPLILYLHQNNGIENIYSVYNDNYVWRQRGLVLRDVNEIL